MHLIMLHIWRHLISCPPWVWVQGELDDTLPRNAMPSADCVVLID